MSDIFKYTSFPDEPAEFDSAEDEQSERIATLKAAWDALNDRYGLWILQQPEAVAFSAAMAFGKEYEAMQDAALAAGKAEG